MTRLPSNLRTLNIRGCYNQHTSFLDANDFVALSVSQTEYLGVLLNSEEKQTFTFDIGNPAQSIDVKGIYFDKYTYTPTGGGNVYYVYIKDPKTKKIKKVTRFSKYLILNFKILETQKPKFFEKRKKSSKTQKLKKV